MLPPPPAPLPNELPATEELKENDPCVLPKDKGLAAALDPKPVPLPKEGVPPTAVLCPVPNLAPPPPKEDDPKDGVDTAAGGSAPVDMLEASPEAYPVSMPDPGDSEP